MIKSGLDIEQIKPLTLSDDEFVKYVNLLCNISRVHDVSFLTIHEDKDLANEKNLIPMFEIGGRIFCIARLGGDFDEDHSWRDSSGMAELRRIFPEEDYCNYVSNVFEAKAVLIFCFYLLWAFPVDGGFHMNTTNEYIFDVDDIDRLMIDCSVRFWHHGAEAIGLWRFGAKSWKSTETEVIENSDAYAFLKSLPSIEGE